MAGIGIPMPAPALILFQSDFEQEDMNCWATRASDGWNSPGCNGWIEIGGTVISLVQNQTRRSGTKSLRIEYTQDEQQGGATREINHDHVYVRFFEYYATDFDFAAGMKTGRISSFNGNTNNYDIILYSGARSSNPLNSSDFCGTNDMETLTLGYNGGPLDWGDVSGNVAMQRGRWYCVEYEVQLNTPGQSNGAVRVWVDDALQAQRTNFNIRGNVTALLNRVMIGGWYSNSAAGQNSCPNPQSASVRYIDDVVIATERIGCGTGGSPPDTTPPQAPRGFRFN